MKNSDLDKRELRLVIEKVKTLLKEGRQDEGYTEICKAMGAYPDYPEPHNLMGLLLEIQKEHGKAMNHFRAAYALDATYLPARSNLDTYGSMFSRGKPAYDESDCAPEKTNNRYEIVYDERGIGKAIPVRKDKNETAKK